MITSQKSNKPTFL